jgi:riboflavin transporter FmnP
MLNIKSKVLLMDSKTLTLILVFSALTTALVLSPFKFPAPYAPFLYYQVWEIPIVTITLLYGLSIGISISALNTIVLLVIFPGAIPTGPIYNLVAIISMLFGIFITKRVIGKNQNNIIENSE